MDRRKFIGILAATAATLKSSTKKGLQDTSATKKTVLDIEEKRELGQSSKRWTQTYTSQDEIIFQWLPTCDPKVKGRLWNDCGKVIPSKG